jgi:hypothetical protein
LTIEQARQNIWYLSQLKQTGQIDQAWGDNLIVDQEKIMNGIIDEAKLLTAGQGTGEQTIRVTGGLPSLPGCNITMPQLNGHVLLTHEPAAPAHDSHAGANPAIVDPGQGHAPPSKGTPH